jgi:hypoxanthine phosphoribosyltransferase
MSDNIQLEDKYFAPFISKEDIDKKVKDCASWIDEVYGNSDELPVVIPILNGAIFFAVDVFRHCKTELQIFPVKISSYKGMQRGKEINVFSSDLGFLRGKDVLIIEDIVDTGHTIQAFRKELNAVLPSSIRIATLLMKPDALECDVQPDFTGFEIENDFVVGYGMDLNEKGRTLERIYRHLG